MTGYIEAYIKNRNESKIFTKKEEINSLEKQFDFHNPCKNLAEKIVRNYDELLGMDPGWCLNETTNINLHANYYRRLLNQ